MQGNRQILEQFIRLSDPEYNREIIEVLMEKIDNG